VNGDWAKPYIDKALELHIIEPNQFTDYNAKITRQSMAVITMNTIYLNEERPTNEYDQYVSNEIKDYRDICGYCAQSVLDAYKMGITTGYSDKTFRGANFSTRAEATTFISKIINTELRDHPDKEYKTSLDVWYWVNSNGERVAFETNIYNTGKFTFAKDDFYMPIYKGINIEEMYDFGKYVNQLALESGDSPFYLFSKGLNNDGFAVYGFKSLEDFKLVYKNNVVYGDQIAALPSQTEIWIGAEAYRYGDYAYSIWLDKVDYDKYRSFIEKMIRFSFKEDAKVVIEKLNNAILTDNQDLIKFGIGGRNVKIDIRPTQIGIEYSVKYQ